MMVLLIYNATYHPSYLTPNLKTNSMQIYAVAHGLLSTSTYFAHVPTCANSLQTINHHKNYLTKQKMQQK